MILHCTCMTTFNHMLQQKPSVHVALRPTIFRLWQKAQGEGIVAPPVFVIGLWYF